jgi:hypothetical protein
MNRLSSLFSTDTHTPVKHTRPQVPESAVLHRGLPWGGIEQLRRGGGFRLSASQFYDPDVHTEPSDEVEAAPWLELIKCVENVVQCDAMRCDVM